MTCIIALFLAPAAIQIGGYCLLKKYADIQPAYFRLWFSTVASLLAIILGVLSQI